MEDIGSKLKLMREKRKLDIDIVAELADITPEELSAIEDGSTAVTFESVLKVIDVLEARLDINPLPASVTISQLRAWVLPSHVSVFDAQSCADEFGYFYIPQRANFEVGDVVYLYITEMFSGIFSRFTVSGVNLPYSDDVKSQDRYWNDSKASDNARQYNRYTRLEYSGNLRKPAPIDFIKTNGFLKMEPTGPIIISEEFRKFLECE